MGRFLAFLFVFVLGAVIGAVVGGGLGAVTGGYVGACKAVDTAVAQGALTQDEANATIKAIAGEVGIKAEQKQQILDALKKSNQPATPCSAAIEAL
jgi:polyhydroxyalkanoate synthesis regulator phasin